jgi:hypothetical protein
VPGGLPGVETEIHRLNRSEYSGIRAGARGAEWRGGGEGTGRRPLFGLCLKGKCLAVSWSCMLL